MALQSVASFGHASYLFMTDHIHRYKDTYYKAGIITLLYLTSRAYFSNPTKHRDAFVAISYPIMHELWARYFIRGSIQRIQGLWNGAADITEETRERQRKFRIIATTLIDCIIPIFLIADHNPLPIRVAAFVLSLLSSYSHSLLAEKTNTLHLSMILHIGRNLCILSLPQSASSSLTWNSPTMITLAIYDLACFYLTTRMI
jgi:hypothetical protein